MKGVHILEKWETEKVIVELHDDGVLHLNIKTGVALSLDDRGSLKDLLQSLPAYSGKFPLMVRMSPFSSILSPEVRTSDNCSATSPIKGAAIMAENLSQRLLAHSYSRAFRDVFPVEVFSDEEEARAWLYTLPSGKLN